MCAYKFLELYRLQLGNLDFAQQFSLSIRFASKQMITENVSQLHLSNFVRYYRFFRLL